MLLAQGDLEGAAILFREELEGCAERLGRSDKETLDSARNLMDLLLEMGASEEAEALAANYSLEQEEGGEGEEEEEEEQEDMPAL